MKKIIFITLSLIVLAFSSCTKHMVEFDAIPLDENAAQFQLHYIEAVAASSSNYIDSVFINDVLYSSVKGSGQLLTYNGIPGGAVGKFFSSKSGSNNIKLYRKGDVIYDRNITLMKGKQNVFIYDMNSDPIVIDNKYPYFPERPSVSETWGTDSIATVSFCNFMFETPGVPYTESKLQYQYKDPRTEMWMNVGEPVGFGEATERCAVPVIKAIFNSSGSVRVDYRIITNDGEVLQRMNTKGVYYDYSDWWTTYIGRSYMHLFVMCRSDKSLRAAVKIWTSQ